MAALFLAKALSVSCLAALGHAGIATSNQHRPALKNSAVLIGKALDKNFSNSDLISRAMSEAEKCFCLECLSTPLAQT